VQYFHAEEIGARPRLAAFAARAADLSVAVSAYTAELLRQAGAPAESMTQIPPGVDIPAAGAAPVRSSAGEPPTVLTVARMEERYKGHDVLVRAMALVRAKVPEARWVVIGEGSLRPAVEQLACGYGLQGAAMFLGAVSDEERERWLWSANVVAMPSRLPAGGLAGEGFGIAFLEAGAHGKPVVAGNVGGALDSVVDGVTGLLVDPLDHLAVAEAIAALLLDPERAGRLGRAGAERARRFAWPVIVERLEGALLEQASA
jgi:phosphatidylinositol alpha-1,6-mannosyltransferase